MRLLLVEDELDIQRFLTHALSEAGYHVDAAGDAKTAMEFAAENVYDILVVDFLCCAKPVGQHTFIVQRFSQTDDRRLFVKLCLKPSASALRAHQFAQRIAAFYNVRFKFTPQNAVSLSGKSIYFDAIRRARAWAHFSTLTQPAIQAGKRKRKLS